MNRYQFLPVLFFVSFTTLAQEFAIEGRIMDKESQGIPFAALGIVKYGYGTVTFEDGSFSLQLKKKYLEDTLIVSALGYKREHIPISRFINQKGKVYLDEEVSTLDEIVVTTDSWKYKLYGEKKKKTGSELRFYSPRDGTTVASLLNEESASMFVKEVRVSVGKRNIEEANLRCMIFSVDDQFLPDQQLLSENLIQEVESRKGVVKFKLPDNFWMDKPFYVGFEWVIKKKQFELLEALDEKFPLDFMDDIREEHPGLQLSIRGGRRAHLADSAGNTVKEFPLTETQVEEVKNRNEENPGIFYQIHSKDDGLKTITGSYITDTWRRYDIHILVSILAAKDPDGL